MFVLKQLKLCHYRTVWFFFVGGGGKEQKADGALFGSTHIPYLIQLQAIKYSTAGMKVKVMTSGAVTPSGKALLLSFFITCHKASWEL